MHNYLMNLPLLIFCIDKSGMMLVNKIEIHANEKYLENIINILVFM